MPQQTELPQGQYVDTSDIYQISTSDIQTEDQGAYGQQDIGGGIDRMPSEEINTFPTNVADAGEGINTADMLDTRILATGFDNTCPGDDGYRSLFNSAAAEIIPGEGVVDAMERESRGWEVREYNLPAPEIMECHTLQVTKGNGMEDIMHAYPQCPEALRQSSRSATNCTACLIVRFGKRKLSYCAARGFPISLLYQTYRCNVHKVKFSAITPEIFEQMPEDVVVSPDIIVLTHRTIMCREFYNEIVGLLYSIKDFSMVANIISDQYRQTLESRLISFGEWARHQDKKCQDSLQAILQSMAPGEDVPTWDVSSFLRHGIRIDSESFVQEGDVDGEDSRSESIEAVGFGDDIEGDGGNDNDAGADVSPIEKLKAFTNLVKKVDLLSIDRSVMRMVLLHHWELVMKNQFQAHSRNVLTENGVRISIDHTYHVVSHLCAWRETDGRKGMVPMKASLVSVIGEDRRVMLTKIVPSDEVRHVKKMLLDEIYAISPKIPTLVYTDNIGKDTNWLTDVRKAIEAQKVQKRELLHEDREHLAPLQVLQDVYHARMRIESMLPKQHPDFVAASIQLKSIFGKICAKSDEDRYSETEDGFRHNFCAVLDAWADRFKVKQALSAEDSLLRLAMLFNAESEGDSSSLEAERIFNPIETVSIC